MSSKRLSTPLGLNQYAPSSNAATLTKASPPELNNPYCRLSTTIVRILSVRIINGITPKSAISSEGAREIEPNLFSSHFAYQL